MKQKQKVNIDKKNDLKNKEVSMNGVRTRTRKRRKRFRKGKTPLGKDSLFQGH